MPSTASTVEHRMPLNGGAISYTQSGTGPVVLLIHGLGGTRRTWQPLIPGLARTHTVIAPDLPGHGLSDPPTGDYSLGTHACAMRDLLLTLGHPRAAIVGHSLGGGVALQVAYQFPQRIERVVLISSGGLGAEVTPMLRAAALRGADTVIARLSTMPAPLAQRLFGFLPTLIGNSDARVLADVLRGLTDDQQRRAFLHTARIVIHRRGLAVGAGHQLGVLREIPLLVAWGINDKTIAPRHHRAFAKRIPHAVTAQISDAGHYPHETAPAQLLSAMQTFLAATQPSRCVENRRVRLLSSPEPVDTRHPANPPRDAPSSDYRVRQ
ncbi:alpha/beta hydrolase [Mycobacterium sp. Aquia_216]|uniref:alpha/beta fold hydrolase n=1 Tax=Mycobacterium sp. Aquia_216 TaxID=2991729 RepID=UPI00227BC324|nr:alpha/beta hydrolase [Mycobacterium sp. Aquia_216]WAJ46658.1 alpha/beta hydrolase [Mycobacterium sp. Aquia_216]